MIDCPKSRLQKAINAGEVDALLAGTSKIKGNEHWINCLRCMDNQGHNDDEQTVVCGYDPDNKITLQNVALFVA